MPAIRSNNRPQSVLLQHRHKGRTMPLSRNEIRKRVAFLFERYQQLTSLLPVISAKPKRAKKTAL